ncbi:MAG: AbrB/MazE/SpoVT family DNA-binding domain-containing protein [Thermomicrobiales bacterium]
MTMVKVQSRRQFTLPSGVRKAAGISPGDTLFVRTIGPGLVELASFRPMTLEEMVERFGVDEPYDDDLVRETAHRELAEEFAERMRREDE